MIDTEKYKKMLEEEQKKLTEELTSIGYQSTDGSGDWKPKPSDIDNDVPDKIDAADAIEAFEENTAILKELETRYQNVLRALKKIEEGTYGLCEVSNEPIESARLDANPAARTCILHKDTEFSA